MIRSMTAFARQHRPAQGRVLCWELRSVNHRFLETAVYLPEELRSLETPVREHVAAVVKRGKLECKLRCQPSSDLSTTQESNSRFIINHGLLDDLLKAAREIGVRVDHPTPINTLELLRWPGVLQVDEPSVEQISSAALSLLDEALRELAETRAREGAQMMALIEQRCSNLHNIVAQVRVMLPTILANLRTRLVERLADLSTQLDPARLEQEMLILAHKMDVHEELERLEMHIKEVSRLLNEDEPVGRRLDFLMQELSREANTLGAKSADAETTRATINMKVLIEQMREQIQNVE